jgi:hypothetical protein
MASTLTPLKTLTRTDEWMLEGISRLRPAEICAS